MTPRRLDDAVIDLRSFHPQTVRRELKLAPLWACVTGGVLSTAMVLAMAWFVVGAEGVLVLGVAFSLAALWLGRSEGPVVRKLEPPAPPIDPWATVNTARGPIPSFADIPAGSFKREGHRISVSAFRMGTTAVTGEQYRRFKPKHDPDDDPTLPVVNVNWDDAKKFCAWVNKKGPSWMKGARLPTEAEWEYACRAGTTTEYWSGDGEEDLARIAWFDENADGKRHPVAEKPESPFGLFDVHGNVFEWCQDWYENYPGEDQQDPQGPKTADDRVVRGGGFFNPAFRCRSAYRDDWGPEWRFHYLGFRLVLPARAAR